MPLGNFNATKLEGPVRIETRNRDIQISDFTNALDVTVERGDIQLLPGSGVTPKMDVHTRAGDIILAMPPGAKYDLSATTDNGEISNSLGGGTKIDERGRQQTLRASNGGPAINLHVNRGDITLRASLPNEAPLAPPIERGERRLKGAKRLKELKPLEQ
jgi:hypothetical protein